jgi:hypothetical protein
MAIKVFLACVGMIPFVKRSAAEPYTLMGPKAVRLALSDASEQIQQVYAGYVYGDSTCGQRVVYELGCDEILQRMVRKCGEHLGRAQSYFQRAGAARSPLITMVARKF